MQIHLEGATSVNARRDRVFGLLVDPGFLAKTLPDAEDVHVLDGPTLEARMRVRVAVVSSALKVRMVVSDTESPSRAKLVAEGSGSGSNLKVVSTFTLTGDSPTTIAWSADAEITGVMAGLGSTLLKSFAAKKVEEIFGGITHAIEKAAG